MENFIFIAQALPTGGLSGFAIPLVIFAIFYFLMIMPMRKKQRKVDQMVAALKNGDRVITGSGIYGVIAGVKDQTFILKIADQVKIEVAKNAIAGLQSPEDSIQQ
jgi:preprotein translocase subunit YajC